MDVGKNSNPFLFDEPASTVENSDSAINPFLAGGTYDYEPTSYSAINPFSDNVTDSVNIFASSEPFAAGGVNPFGDISEPNVNIFSQPETATTNSQFDIFGSSVPAEDTLFSSSIPTEDSLFGSTVPVEDSLFGNVQQQPIRPPRPPSPRDILSESPQPSDIAGSPGRPPPPRPPPPSKETKDLLQTVIGAIEATTDTLQDKLNTTRTPCPSPCSVTQHSRSPTPDIQITAPEKEEDAFSTVFGQTIELSDPETDDGQVTSSNTSRVIQEPESTEIDLFGDGVNSKPKTTQDILNLYKKTSESEKSQTDLLSGDLISENNGIVDELNEENVSTFLQNDDLLASNVLTSKSNDTILTTNQAQILEVDTNTNNNSSHSDPVNSEAGISPDQVSDKSGSESTVIETTKTYDGKIKDDESATLSDFQPQNTCLPTEVTAEFESELIIPTNANEYQGTELPSQIFSPSISPSLSEQESQRKNSGGPFAEQIAPRRESIEHLTDQIAPRRESINNVSSRKESISSNAEHTSSRKASFASNADQTCPRKESIGSHSEKSTHSRKESIGSYADHIASRKASSESHPDPITSRKESIGSHVESVASRKQSIGSFTEEVIPRTQSGGTFAEQPTPNVANVYNTEIGIVERSDNYINNSPQKVESGVGISTNAFNVSQAQVLPPESIFGDFPSSTIQPPSTGFSIFGDDIPSKTTIAGPDSTGASLFQTSAPAPNVGMSLFGAGHEATLDIFAESTSNTMVNPFAPTQQVLPSVEPSQMEDKHATEEEFDAFSARFDNVTASNLQPSEATFDPFSSSNREATASPWGGQAKEGKADGFGFDDNAQFDSFLSMNEPPPPPKRRHVAKKKSPDSDEGQMNIVIKPMAGDAAQFPSSPLPVLAPPPAVSQTAFADSTPRFNPFDRNDAFPGIPVIGENEKGNFERSDSQETPPTPLFEEDQSVPLEPYPRTHYDGTVWEMYLRQPNKKKITGQRFWKKIYLKLTTDGALQLYNNKDDKEPFQELPLQPCYSVSDIGAQQFDQFGKIFTLKVQYIFYKERPGVRPGQISKAERITTKLSKFAQSAIAGDYEGVKEFASDVRKLGMPVEHAPQISQLLKLGTQNYEDLKIFASLFEENMFKLVSTRERALNYKTQEIQLTAVDETFVEQDLRGAVLQMVARVRIFFLSFLTGITEVDLGINDLRKQGHEIVGRHDIIPVVTEEWIRLEDIEFHCTVDREVFEATRHIKFRPPDACYIELMRYRVRPPKNRELPLQVKTKFIMQGKQVDIQCEILVPGFSGRKLGQVPCEDIAVRFPLPECWIYMFRVEKHFRYGSVKSAHRRTGKVKGMERFKGTVESAESALMEVTSGQAKYEHQHRSIVWRMSRLPKEGQGAYSVHQFTCKMHLTSYDQIPTSFDKHCIVEFTMPATTVSHCVMRSISVSNDEPPEKYVRYLARHEYKVEIEFTSGSGPGAYIAATKIEPERKEERKIEPVDEESSSDESD